MSFFRHPEIYRSDVFNWSGNGVPAAPGLIVCDEFPAGYSSANCSPAGSASASPTVDHFALKSSCRSMAFHRTANSVLTVCLSSGGHPILCLWHWRPPPPASSCERQFLQCCTWIPYHPPEESGERTKTSYAPSRAVAGPAGPARTLIGSNQRVRIKHIFGLNLSSATRTFFRFLHGHTTSLSGEPFHIYWWADGPSKHI